MWPWGHLGFAYLLYSYSTHRRFDRAPQPAPALAFVFGSQLPDLIDKPLAWWLGVLPSGRSLAHSLFFAAVVISLAYVLAHRVDRVELATAFTVGHLSHLLADIPPRALLGYPRGTEFLLWPLLDQHRFEHDPHVFEVPGALEVVVLPLVSPTVYGLAQFGLFVAAALVWYRDGMPGLEYVPFVSASGRVHREGGG